MSHAKRPISGILCLDKPAGMSSNRALQIVKRLFQAQKAGHTGTLDPIATGLLPICFGEATKFASMALLEADKRYVTRARLGTETETGDIEGAITASAQVPPLSGDAIEAVLTKFRGQITQTPPVYSALKKDGKPLYQYARAGESVEIAQRTVHIWSCELISYDQDRLDLSVHVSKGTYIRSLVQDIGRALGCGAHVETLRRTAVGPLTMQQMMSIECLKSAADAGLNSLETYLLPTESLLTHLPAVHLTLEQAQRVMQGQSLKGIEPLDREQVRLLSPDGFIGIGRFDAHGLLCPKRLCQAQTTLE